MKAIREARLIGAFLVMIALGVLLKSHFSMPILATLSAFSLFIGFLIETKQNTNTLKKGMMKNVCSCRGS